MIPDKYDPGIIDIEPNVRDLISELFPVTVTLPNGESYGRAKVFVLVGGIVVYADAGKVFAARHASHPRLANPNAPKRRQLSTFDTVDGTVTAQGILGCGCGSPLKTLTYAQVFGA